MAEKSYKWTVRPGGTIPADALNVKAATDQTGSTSTKHLTQIAQNHAGHDAKLPSDTLLIKTLTSVPDSRMGNRSQHNPGTSEYGPDAVHVSTAVNAPKPAPTVNNIDMTEQRHQAVAKFS